MQEIKYREIQTKTENGRSLLLSYIVLADKSKSAGRYGVRVVEQNSGETAQAADLTTDAGRIYDLVDQLARCAVTPTTLADIVADWAREGVFYG